MILVAAYFIRGISGFGSGLVAVPLLALLFPLKLVVPFMLLMDFTGSLLLGGANRKQVSWPELRPLMPGAVLGVIAGVILLVHLDRQILLTSLGLLVFAFGMRSVLNLQGNRLISRVWAIPASIAGGIVSALFGTGGPPYVIYLSHRIYDKGVFRATTSLLFLMEGGLRGVVFASAGLLWQPQLLRAYLSALPFMALGLMLGSKVHIGISHAQMLRLIGVLLLGSGLSLLAKAWL